MKLFSSIFTIIVLLFTATRTNAQVQLKGYVYDSLGRTPVPYVSVLTSSGKGTSTAINGSYSILVSAGDSIWFSYLNKPTRKFPVSQINTPYSFDISLRVNIPDLPEVKVRNPDYHFDSLQNRETYRKYFDFEKPGLSTSTYNNGTPNFGVGFDLTELVNAFRFGRTRKYSRFREKLITDEQDGYVRYRFSKSLIRRITGMTEDSVINEFITMYQPSYLFTSRAGDYVFHEYIKKSYERFKLGLLPPPMWKEGYDKDDEREISY